MANVKKKSKENAVKSAKKVTFEKESGGLPIISLLSAAVLVGFSVLVYTYYKDATQIPNMPAIDLNEWWGKNTTDPTDTSIRPYRIVFSDAMQDEITFQFQSYRRELEKVKSFGDTAWTYGIHSDALGKFHHYWSFKYDYRKRPKFLNKFEQFKTRIQGLDVHFLHVKPKVDKDVMVLPLLLLHGWPGSVREFYEAIPLLTTPRKGYNFVFEVIAPSLPGFIFSEAPSRPGLAPHKIAIIMRNLMQRLGHHQFYVQGGDFGHVIGSNMATIFPNQVLGFHTNVPNNFVNKNSLLVWVLGSIWPSYVAGEHADKWYPLGDKIKYYLEEFGYAHLQMTKPDTIGIALQNSVKGLAAYILDRFMILTDPANKLDPDGGFEKYYDYDKLLDNILLYWISGSITTAMRLYKESAANIDVEHVFSNIPTTVPTWGLRFKHELIFTPDFVLKWKYPNLVGTTNFDFGGHFAAFEKPEEFSTDLFKAVKSFLSFNK